MKETITLKAAMSASEKEKYLGNTFQKERKKLFDFIRKRVPSSDDAEDILQDVFYQFLQNFEPIEQVTSWLFRVARNKITDSYRKKKPTSFGDFSSSMEEDVAEPYFLRSFFDPNDNPEDDMVRSLVWEVMEEALNELPEEQREAFVLHEIEGKDFKEIAELKNVPVNTLLSRKRYAVLHLRERLKDLYNEVLNK